MAHIHVLPWNEAKYPAAILCRCETGKERLSVSMWAFCLPQELQQYSSDKRRMNGQFNNHPSSRGYPGYSSCLQSFTTFHWTENFKKQLYLKNVFFSSNVFRFYCSDNKKTDLRMKSLPVSDLLSGIESIQSPPESSRQTLITYNSEQSLSSHDAFLWWWDGPLAGRLCHNHPGGNYSKKTALESMTVIRWSRDTEWP